ncbi:hypothetical protein [Candidatus Solirubrobacter pratensis]|uniref:hypothetical protein n=1 Tax=Candidatus Solirubrobacter pratensis TaxID=1298857 RepID=UPI000480632C|nr:hypothetical protein [Candidatus Solirubrobacter pratensis]
MSAAPGSTPAPSRIVVKNARAGLADDDQALGLQRGEEAGVRVQGRDRSRRADARGQRGGEAARARAGVQAVPARRESKPLAQGERARVIRGREAVEAVALGVPGGVERVAGGEDRWSHTA